MLFLASQGVRVSRQTVLGFGCASLYRLPSKRDRLAILDCAYELGIRHFDVAPIYGLGLAEKELAEFRARHRDIAVATKFGIYPTRIGRVAGRIQPAVRAVLQRYPGMQRRMKESGDHPDSGVVGRVLYASDGFSPDAAHCALNRSLSVLQADRIDYFMLHEPSGFAGDYGSLIDYLDAECANGRIGRWGLAGHLGEASAAMSQLVKRAGALQFPYDLFGGPCGPASPGAGAVITFGCIAHSLPRMRDLLKRRPALRQECSALLDADLIDPQVMVGLLIRNALSYNPSGVVLLSSTNADHLRSAHAAAHSPLRNEEAVADLIRAADTAQDGAL